MPYNNPYFNSINQLLIDHSTIRINFARRLNRIYMLRTTGVILAAFYCLIFLCSCQKDSDTNTPPITDTTTAGESYMPLTEGTYWVYRDSASNGYDTATVLGED